MDRKSAETKLRDDFEEWSGGFPPESDRQIFVFVEYAMSTEFGDQFVRDYLREWMAAEEASDSNG